MSHKGRQSFITGAAVLGLAALLSKIMGAIYRIPYQNITGDVGLAVYNKVYPLYSMLLILATAGFPIAVSKIVSERLALGDKVGARRVLTISIYVLTITGFIFFGLLYFGSNILAKMMGNQDLSIAIKSVSFALLIVPTMAALRGYYQGHQYMIPTAYSQIIEQIVRVTTILFLSYWFMRNGYGVYYAGAGAVFGAVTGAVFAFLVLLFFWRKTERITNEMVLEAGTIHLQEKEPARSIIKRILYYSLPIALGSLVLPLLGVVDSFTVSNILSYAITHSQSWFGIYIKEQTLAQFVEYWFGIYTRGQPLVQFTAFFATALSLAIVPAISEAQTKKHFHLIAERSELALRLTLMIGLPASMGLAVLAQPVNIMLYRDDVGSLTLAILAFTTIFSTLGITSSGILQGLGQVILPARNLFIGVLLKLILNIVLIYYFHINGAAFATVFAYAIATTLNIVAINRHIDVKIGFINFFVKPIMATIMMGVLVYFFKYLLTLGLAPFIESERMLMAMVALISVGIGIFAFAISLFISGALTRKDLQQIPKYGNRLIMWTDRMKILKD